MSNNYGTAVVGKSNGKRNPNDFYPTPKEVLESFVLTEGQLPEVQAIWNKGIWEPSAGNGVLCDVFTSFDYSTYGSHIEPQRDDIHGQDFLTTDSIPDTVGACITNPPFTLTKILFVMLSKA